MSQLVMLPDGIQVCDMQAVNSLLAEAHYLGPVSACRYAFIWISEQEPVAAMVYRWPTARYLPSDGSWLELARWCLTPGAGKNAGSRMDRWTRRWLLTNDARVTTLVSYSDPSAGHTGALYKACNWQWRPTWHRLQPPPTGNGNWGGDVQQSVKDRWIYPLRDDADREQIAALPYDWAQKLLDQRD